MNSTVRNIICVLISLAGILYLVIGIRQEKAAETAKIAEAREEQKQTASEITAEDSGRGWEADENTDSFYQKLVDGFDVKILVVGDTFADGPAASSVDKRWTSLLPKAIADEYDVKADLKTLILDDNTSYSFYAMVKQMSAEESYDLVIICSGQYDAEETSAVHYEALIRALREKFGDINMISILEHAQKEYTAKITGIQSLAEHYGLQTADMIESFREEYDPYTTYDFFPNDEGHQAYCDTLMEVIKENAEAGTGRTAESVDFMDGQAANYEVLTFIPASDFDKTDNTRYTLNAAVAGNIGIDFDYINGENGETVVIDGEDIVYEKTKKFNNPASQRQIVYASGDVNATVKIRVKFESKEEADTFRGLFVSTAG